MKFSPKPAVANRKPLAGRFTLLIALLILYVSLSTVTRIILFIWSEKNVSGGFYPVFRAFILGFGFDMATSLSLLLPYGIYLLVFPKKWIGSRADKVFTYCCITVILMLIFFSLMAEFPFWDEFGVRFNFIAVDYLIYTYEVISNINQSYPIPLIVAALAGLVFLSFRILGSRGMLHATFSSKTGLIKRGCFFLPIALATLILLGSLNNKQAEYGSNLVVNELGKNGVFSFFAALRSNELDYNTFYPRIADTTAYNTLKKNLLQNNQHYLQGGWNYMIRNTVATNEQRPNIILIAIESFSADFVRAFGNEEQLTPNFDSLAKESIFFTNLYATGTRTVRGMEALTLCVPPTPGNSIVRRPGNEHLFSSATILRQKGYQPYFIYGGDGYFDNMNNFFGGQGFDIVDRDRGNPLSDNITTHRYTIPDKEVHFENAWGICDEDLYSQAITYADKSSNAQKPFFEFVMTTSNHKPFTFPEGKINLPKGSRNAAVKYTDFALGKFIRDARTKPWFRNTVFLVVADHCASSAGRWEININRHHIPAIIFNLPQPPQKIDRLVSQIDLMPTLFGYLNWNYRSAFYGKDINATMPGDERAFIGNYRTLGLLKNNLFTQIDDHKRIKQFQVKDKGQSLSDKNSINNALVTETISYYQTASERFKTGKMKE